VVRYWATSVPGGDSLVAALAAGDPGEFWLQTFDLSSCRWAPWAPFGPLTPGSQNAPGTVYFRHRHLWEGPGVPPPEPLIEEELAWERGQLADTLVDSLGSRGPGILLVRHAELLGPEALFLAERFRDHPRYPLALLFFFEQAPPRPEAFDRLDSLGYVTWMGPSPLVPAGPLAGGEPGPEDPERRELLRWLCFETVAILPGEAASLDRLEALASAGEFELGIDLGEALVRRWASSTDVRVLGRIWSDLARLYRQAGDPASAARCLTLGWKQARDAGDTPALAQCDFLLFEASYRTLVTDDVYLGLEERLTEALEALGWANHLAYVLTKNAWVQTVGRTRGWDQAWALWNRGRRLIRRLANPRRLAVALQTQGSLRMARGDLPGALASTRRAVRLAGLHSSALHVAKVQNGMGFLCLAAGQFAAARHHHAQALELVAGTRDLHEYIGTLVNLGRLYLFNDQASLALPILTAAVRTLDSLGISELPFVSRSHTHVLLGASCLKMGQAGRALEFLNKVRAEEDKTGRADEHRAVLEALVAGAQGDRGRFQALVGEAARVLEGRVADLRPLLIWFLLETGRCLAEAGDRAGAERAWVRAEAFVPPAPVGQDLRRHLDWLRTGKRRPPVLGEVSWDSALLVRFSRQEQALRGLRRSVQDYGFLHTWHRELVPGLGEAGLLARAVVLVRTHFPVETVVVLGGTEPEVLALAPGSDPRAAHQAARSLPGPTLVAVFPLVHSGRTQARLVCVDTHPQPIFGDSDRRVLELAADHLAVLLLSERKALDLEERGARLARALEELKQAQDRLVLSENLAVLGTLSAGLAHELNTPVGAILSASRTVSQLVEGPVFALALEDRRAGDGERSLLGRLLGRLTSRPANLAATDRRARRDLGRLWESRGVPGAADLADQWFEAGLGGDLDLLEPWPGDGVLAGVLDRLVPLAQAFRLSRVIEESAHRAEGVVGSLRSSLQDGSTEDPSEFLLQDELVATLAVLGNRVGRGITVVFDLPAAFKVQGRRLSLSQVWTNLVHNAVQAMEGQGTLTLGARRRGNEVWVEVTDTGPGIPESQQARIFTPFFSTKKQTGGLGLGLDISRRIVEAHGGRMEFESRPGRTVFRVRLPFSR
jgi:signal transduction histidine kinase/tetratricopeptide (TPR) repeat protein